MKKTILFFGKVPPPYIGPAIATRIILNSNLNDFYKIFHFNTSHHRNFKDLGKFSFTNIITPFILYFRLIYNIILKQPDIIYIPSQQTTIAYLRDIPFFILTKLFRVKLVCHLRGGYFLEFYNESNIIMKFVINNVQKLVDAQIVLGYNLINLYKPFMPIKKIYVVPNGGDYDYELKKNNNRNKINILFLGNLIREKGIIDFLDSRNYFPKEFLNNILYQFAGNHNDCKDEIDNFITGASDTQIKYYGPVSGEQKLKLLSEADIFVFPTFYRNEGHPWVIVEALAAGLPIISTDRGAILESVIDGYNGFIVEPNNPKEISIKILNLINDKDLRIKMGKNSLSLYKKKYTQANLINNLKNVFDNVIN